MKCYICLTDSIVNRKDYFNMLKVTLISARKNTSLRLICLYDGKIGDPVYNLPSNPQLRAYMIQKRK